MSTSNLTETLIDPHSNGAIGFVNPIALMIPSTETLGASSSPNWLAGGYSFALARVDQEVGEWCIITSTPNSETTQDYFSSEVLVSQTSGVLSFAVFKNYHGEQLRKEFYSCGHENLRYSDLALLRSDPIQ